MGAELSGEGFEGKREATGAIKYDFGPSRDEGDSAMARGEEEGRARGCRSAELERLVEPVRYPNFFMKYSARLHTRLVVLLQTESALTRSREGLMKGRVDGEIKN